MALDSNVNVPGDVFSISLPGVEAGLKNLDDYVENLVNLYTKLEGINLQAGWDSTTVRGEVNRRLEIIRNNIDEIKGCISRVRENVEKHKLLVEKADEAGISG